MPIAYRKKTAFFETLVTVEDAEDLLQWIQKNPQGKVDLSGCTHLHAANLQVLMAAGCSVIGWPKDANLSAWLQSALRSN